MLNICWLCHTFGIKCPSNSLQWSKTLRHESHFLSNKHPLQTHHVDCSKIFGKYLFRFDFRLMACHGSCHTKVCWTLCCMAFIAFQWFDTKMRTRNTTTAFFSVAYLCRTIRREEKRKSPEIWRAKAKKCRKKNPHDGERWQWQNVNEYTNKLCHASIRNDNAPMQCQPTAAAAASKQFLKHGFSTEHRRIRMRDKPRANERTQASNGKCKWMPSKPRKREKKLFSNENNESPKHTEIDKRANRKWRTN